MAAITRIDAYVVTADLDGAGTDSHVYLGVAGREFALDTDANDFERDAHQTFTLGNGSNVRNAAKNDPRAPQLDSGALDDYPVYLRAPGADWALDRAIVTVRTAEGNIVFDNLSIAGDGKHVWLGATSGEYFHLTRQPSTN